MATRGSNPTPPITVPEGFIDIGEVTEVRFTEFTRKNALCSKEQEKKVAAALANVFRKKRKGSRNRAVLG